MPSTWSEDAARYLLRVDRCPRCGAELTPVGICPQCGTDLGGEGGERLWAASQRAAEAIRARQALIDALPVASVVMTTVPAVQPAQVAHSMPSAPAPAYASPAAEGPQYSHAPQQTGAPPAAAAAPAPEGRISVQSVLAVAGAGLFAVAAFVFTFLNPDLTDFGTRRLITAGVTVLFLAGSWLLASRRIRFSAEAIGALGMVFVAIDVWALGADSTPPQAGWLWAGAGTLVAGAALAALGSVIRLRSWVWSALIGIAVAPVLLSFAAELAWVSAVGWLAVAGVVLALQLLLLPVLRRRFDSPLRADVGALAVLHGLAGLAMVALLPFLEGTNLTRVLGASALLAGYAATAIVASRVLLPGLWSFVAGAAAAVAVAILPLAIVGLDAAWHLALVPLAAALAAVATGAVELRSSPGPAPAGPRIVAVQVGALSVLFTVAIPAAFSALLLAALPALEALRAGTTSGLEDSPAGPAAMLGLAAVAIGTSSFGLLLARRRPAASRGYLVAGLWIAALPLLALPGWLDLSRPAAALIAVAVAVLSASLAPTLPTPALRAPLLAIAHALLLQAALVSWGDQELAVTLGIVIVAALVPIVRLLPALARPFYLAGGYAYALVVLAAALDLAGLDPLPVLALTTTAASLFALAATVTGRLSAAGWWAVLAVTAVPFLIGVATVLFERSGWTALSTASIFLLALTLLLSRRRGLTGAVRSVAASLLVPALAVVVITLGAQLLAGSASPVTLPIIATIVALTLATSRLIALALEKRGIASPEVAAARFWIEASTLVTAAIAVLLALLRSAAGLDTAFVVLLVIGLGAALASVLARRRYGWWVAYGSFTGALWCLWARIGVDVAEPYFLPPALAAVLVGAVLVARRKPASALFVAGLAVAIVPTLVLLGVAGPGAGTGMVPWRTIGLLGASVVLLTVGWAAGASDGALGRWFAPVSRPLLLGAIVSAGAGPVQAVRWGLERDFAPFLTVGPAMGPVLVLSIAAALLAAIAGSRLQRSALGSWRYAPALVFLVVGPWSAIERNWFAIWSLWGLMLALLALAVATVVLHRARAPFLPPFWFSYALAWISGVVGWGPRDLRVEVFSLPLGLAVVVAGVLAWRWRESSAAARTLANWPYGSRSSWWSLGPGIVLTLLPSVLATGTDPVLYRPIMVIALALVAILVGSSLRLAAPFLIGLIVLPIENVVVFAAQIDRAVGAMPWWITLATAGAVLLAIAVSAERRTTQGRGVAARLRELR